MKISYIFQLKDFLILLAVGFVLGIIYGLFNISSRIKSRYFLQIITDFLFVVIFSGTFFILINIINMGEIRLFLAIGYLFGFYIERITLGKLFAKGYIKMYNILRNLFRKIFYSKIGRFIFK